MNGLSRLFFACCAVLLRLGAAAPIWAGDRLLVAARWCDGKAKLPPLQGA